MDKLYRVIVYEFAKYNDNDKILYNNHKQHALKKEYTWGVHNLERTIRSYKWFYQTETMKTIQVTL